MSFEKNSASVSWPEIAPSASYPARRARARRFVGAIAAGVLGADLLLSGCGQGVQAEPATKTVTVEPSPTAGATAATQIHGQLTFDWLNGNSPIIQVYPSPADTPQARISDGTFENGQVVGVICQTQGRDVTSVPPETPRESSTWYEITAGGQDFYATAVYAEVKGGPIPHC